MQYRLSDIEAGDLGPVFSVSIVWTRSPVCFGLDLLGALSFERSWHADRVICSLCWNLRDLDHWRDLGMLCPWSSSVVRDWEVGVMTVGHGVLAVGLLWMEMQVNVCHAWWFCRGLEMSEMISLALCTMLVDAYRCKQVDWFSRVWGWSICRLISMVRLCGDRDLLERADLPEFLCQNVVWELGFDAACCCLIFLCRLWWMFYVR